MKQFAFIVVVVGLLAMAGAARAAEKEAPIDWPARAASVKVGMMRLEVQRILPEWKPPPNSGKAFGPVTMMTDMWNRARYMVSEDLRVTVTYDYSHPAMRKQAFATDDNGGKRPAPLQDWICSLNRVIAPVKIEKFTPLPAYDPAEFDEKLSKQVEDILKECEKIKPGMTRADLMKVFTTEGGLFTPTNQTFVHRRCNFIKVDVEFSLSKPIKSSDWKEKIDEEGLAADIITRISRPYLGWMVFD